MKPIKFFLVARRFVNLYSGFYVLDYGKSLISISDLKHYVHIVKKMENNYET